MDFSQTLADLPLEITILPHHGSYVLNSVSFIPSWMKGRRSFGGFKLRIALTRYYAEAVSESFQPRLVVESG
jgi:hypothetical protein